MRFGRQHVEGFKDKLFGQSAGGCFGFGFWQGFCFLRGRGFERGGGCG